MSATSRSLLLAFSVQCLTWGGVAALRPVDGDEGYYLMAARLVLEGGVPYRDFFFPQMPLLPYLYAAWMGLLGANWYAGRALSVLLAATLGCLLFRHVLRVHGSHAWAWVALLFYAASTQVMSFVPLAKSYALSSVLAFAAFSQLRPEGWTRNRALLCGALLGLAVCARLPMAILLPVVLVHGLAASTAGRRTERVLALAAGFGLALVPALVTFALAPEAFWFGNVSYHALRSETGLVENLAQKLWVVRWLLGAPTFESVVSNPRAFGSGAPQLSGLLWANLAYLALMARRRRSFPAALSFVLALSFVSILPTPSYPQYFAILVPYLCLNAVALLVEIATMGARGPALAGASAAFACVLTLVFGGVGAQRVVVRGWPLVGVAGPADAPNRRVPHLREVAAAIDALVEPGEEVLAEWPGYLLESEGRSVPGFENHFAHIAARALPADERRAFHVLSKADLLRMVGERRVRVAVVGLWTPDVLGEALRPALLRAGYRLHRRIGATEVYLRRPR